MPKQRIIEKDFTGSLLKASIVNTVYIPLKANNDKLPQICEEENDLIKYVGEDPVTSTSTGYKFAKYLLKKGFKVLCELINSNNATIPETCWKRLKDKSVYDIRFITTGDFEGIDLNAIACAQERTDCVVLCDCNYTEIALDTVYMLTAKAPTDWTTNWNKYYTRKAIFNPVAGTTAPKFEYNKYYMRTGSEGSYVYSLLINKPSDWDTSYINYYYLEKYEFIKNTQTTMPTWVENTYYEQTSVDNTIENQIRTYVESKFESQIITDDRLKYASVIVPRIITKSSDITGDALGTTELTLPASCGYLLAYLNNSINNVPEYIAVAGSLYGNIPEIAYPEHIFSNAQCEILQARARDEECVLDKPNKDNVGIAINPIAPVRPFGYILWGNRTALETKEGYSLKASSFLNVRNLISTISKKLYDTSRKYTFAQNNNALWLNFQSEVNPTLERIKTGGGILDYRWIKESDTTKKARLTAKLRIIPIEPVEDFDLEIDLTDTLEII